ncbi:MAG TPA: DnaJ domain-containing protein, partial [Candidatus Saccharimonadales bacterium]|nr:DnaJ domain-containing protein [Candidatus Saccharimonadales bacterium]
MYLKKFIIAIICCFIIINSSIYGSFQRFSKRPVASNVVTSSSKAASTLLTSTRPYHQEAQLYHQYTPALTKAAGENVVPEVAYNSFSPLTTQPLLLQAPLDRKKAGKIFFDALQQRAQGKTVQYDDSPESQAARQVIEETVPAYEQAEAQFAKEEKEGTVNYDLADQTRTELYKNQLRSLLKHGIITSTEHDALLSNFQIAMDDLKERRNAQRMRNETQERSSAAHEKAAKVLGVSKNASQKEINAAYKKAAFKAHPDRGGSEAEMKRI